MEEGSESSVESTAESASVSTTDTTAETKAELNSTLNWDTSESSPTATEVQDARDTAANREWGQAWRAMPPLRTTGGQV